MLLVSDTIWFPYAEFFDGKTYRTY